MIIQGGGWCNTRRNCVFRKTTRRGSSNHMEKVLAFTGILSNKANENPGLFVSCPENHHDLFYHLLPVTELSFFSMQTFSTGTESNCVTVMVPLSLAIVRTRLVSESNSNIIQCRLYIMFFFYIYIEFTTIL